MTEPSRIGSSSIAGSWYEDVLVGKEPERAQLWFLEDVLDRYRKGDGFSVIRTDNAGRVSASREWAVDFGIVEGERAEAGRLLHAAVGALLRLPKKERKHWAAYVVTPPVNEQFLELRSQAGACMDDGEIRRF